MKPVLKHMHSPDVLDLDSYVPADPTCFGFLLDAMFGPEVGEGEESFSLIVCSPAWLAIKVESQGIVDGRHHLIVKEFDSKQIRSFLETYASSCTGQTWGEVARQLSRLGKWEFEDYQP
jgi:hypothetical protein